MLSTYAIVRLGSGTVVLCRMISDMIVTFKDPHPVGTEHLLPGVQEPWANQVRLQPLLALLQVGAMVLLHFQGFHWFSKILRKGDLQERKKL
jgi:hypothetical protein